ncbi:glutaminase [Nitritalea halalkaliphila LW7]|uniref:glutaminase n=1 Tax=Nitritalea halalkaliphila LW7 TaxID=1189621 RepID=I5C9I7_9BACT|nr:glutaminase [Nitritalea halalkaliphila LW7]
MTTDYADLIQTIYTRVKKMDLRGQVANYIPELAEVDPEQFGIALVDTEGNVYGAGDYQKPFSIQSISKVFTLMMVFHVFKQKLWQRVNVEPSGNPFNSIAQLEFEGGIPRNPFINAGALVITDALYGKYPHALQAIVDFVNELAGKNCVTINEAVKRSELAHAQRNKALAYFLKAYQNFHHEVEEVLETYVAHCAIEMSCEDLAKAFSCFALDGYSPFAQRRILSESHTRRLNA